MGNQKPDNFPVTLMATTPEDGFVLAITLSRLAVKATQPETDALANLSPDCANSADSLIAVSHVVAVHFSTIAQANQYWPDIRPASGESS